MYFKKLKRKCDVRGCKCTESFAISLTREMGNSIIVCKSCLEKALSTIKDNDHVAQDNFPASPATAVPPLFFNSVALGLKTENTESTANNQINDIPPVDDKNINDDITNSSEDDKKGFQCSKCGKLFDSERGLSTHLRHCKERSDSEQRS